MSQHTKGFLSAGCEDDPKSGDIYADDGSLIAECFINGDPETKEANARRLAACWNACDGLTNEFLEISKTGDYVIRLIREADGYLLQRDELLVALKRVVDDWVHPDGGEFEDGEMPALDAARAAIEKIYGGAA